MLKLNLQLFAKKPGENEDPDNQDEETEEEELPEWAKKLQATVQNLSTKLSQTEKPKNNDSNNEPTQKVTVPQIKTPKEPEPEPNPEQKESQSLTEPKKKSFWDFLL